MRSDVREAGKGIIRVNVLTHWYLIIFYLSYWIKVKWGANIIKTISVKEAYIFFWDNQLNRSNRIGVIRVITETYFLRRLWQEAWKYRLFLSILFEIVFNSYRVVFGLILMLIRVIRNRLIRYIQITYHNFQCLLRFHSHPRIISEMVNCSLQDAMLGCKSVDRTH